MALTLSCSVDAKVKLFKSTLTRRGRCAVKQRRVPAKARYYKHPCASLWKFVPLGGSPQKRSNAESLVAKGLSRQVVKRKANYIIKMFDRGVALELIPLEYAMRLKTLGSIEMPIKPKRQVWGVDLKLVEATQAELTPVVADMVQLQLLIGARPSEVCNLRPCDIDRTGDVWIYIPAKHKTQHHGHSRRIVIGPKAQQVLARYLLRDPKAFCFTPIEAYEQHYQ